ncbi:hypothetical protein TNCV_2636911 [Trichonephila clavipes]|uniref:Uncharacterized protein n=1 Tax=Trichonephila clavipes TaxID=2585209 RepID=A0A8X6R880_TRICX|nr:hypothetical protein TNCV_2636911 [Trichonephila clavipes]
MPNTSRYNLRHRKGAKVESRPSSVKRIQQEAPVRSEKGNREQQYNPYTEEQRSDCRSTRSRRCQQQHCQERTGEVNRRRSHSLEVLVGDVNYKTLKSGCMRKKIELSLLSNSPRSNKTPMIWLNTNEEETQCPPPNKSAPSVVTEQLLKQQDTTFGMKINRDGAKTNHYCDNCHDTEITRSHIFSYPASLVSLQNIAVFVADGHHPPLRQCRRSVVEVQDNVEVVFRSHDKI